MPTVREKLIELLDRQTEKGLKKYGTTIDEAYVDENGDEYDWGMMIAEELIDGIQYSIKKVEELEREINTYKMAEKLNKAQYDKLFKEHEELRKRYDMLKWSQEQFTEDLTKLVRSLEGRGSNGIRTNTQAVIRS
jgi:hypothetical protein